MERRDPRWVSGLTLATQSQVNVLSGYSFSCDSVANRCGVLENQAALWLQGETSNGSPRRTLGKAPWRPASRQPESWRLPHYTEGGAEVVKQHRPVAR